MFVLRRRSPLDLEPLLVIATDQDPSYPEVGATAAGALPRGYHHGRHRRRIGDAQVFDLAVAGLRRWVAHEGAGVQIFPRDQPVSVGATMLAVLSFGPAQVIAPCRIVSVINETDNFGFAVGTLPGHPERGEEAFLVERCADGTYFSITAFSKLADPLARLIGPVSRAVQHAINRRCLDALARYAKSDS